MVTSSKQGFLSVTNSSAAITAKFSCPRAPEEARMNARMWQRGSIRRGASLFNRLVKAPSVRISATAGYDSLSAEHLVLDVTGSICGAHGCDGVVSVQALVLRASGAPLHFNLLTLSESESGAREL